MFGLREESSYLVHNVTIRRTLRLQGAFLLAAVALSALATAQERTYLNIGDEAPVLKPAQWLKGGAIPSFQKGQIYVVEFWATWCGPCKENIPHLTELQKKYGETVSIIGVDVWESNDPEAKTTIPKVAAFVKAQGAKMDYHVAVDAADNRVANAWMKKADEGGLPTSFIVGKDGKIAWIGHPANLESVLNQVVAGTFDVAASREQRALSVETTRPIAEAITAKRYADVLKLTDAAIAKRPEQAGRYTYDRLIATFHVDLGAGKTAAEAILDESSGEIGAYRMIASIFASSKDLSPDAYRYGKTIIEKALEKEEMKYMFLAMGAEVNASLGDFDGAVKMQEESVKAAEVDSHAPSEFVDFLRKNLAKFRLQATKKN